MSSSAVRINLADVVIAFSSDKKINEERKQKRFKNIISDVKPDIIIEEVHSLPGSTGLSKGNLIFDAPHWSYYKQNGYKIFVNKPSAGDPALTALFNHGLSKGKVYLPEPGYDWMGSRLALVIIENLLSLRKRFMFHGCGIAEKNKGFLFIGDSGAGKTTMSALWHKKGGLIIHDDRMTVYKKGPHYVMTGLRIFSIAKPSHYRPEEKVALSNIFFLKHGQKNTLDRKNQLDVFKTILKKTPSSICDRNGLKKMLSFYWDLTKAVPGGNLAFIPDPACVDFIRERR
jgi:hypothetical protein